MKVFKIPEEEWSSDYHISGYIPDIKFDGLYESLQEMEQKIFTEDWQNNKRWSLQMTEITRIEIFIWALIFSRFETARIMWKNSNESIGLALAGALFFRNAVKNAGENTGCLGKGFQGELVSRYEQQI